MLELAHKVEWLGAGRYRCVNCGNQADKDDMAAFMAEKCPAIPDYGLIASDVAKIFEKTGKVADALAEVKALVLTLDSKVNDLKPEVIK